ncbi:hypothetical protein F4779DRAFT_618043 [Xylariaceae sp. FL0662B]|nr:hypothetical protein F4779DRAFT_618043 [Xylariaceae sp. FL0662B]
MATNLILLRAAPLLASTSYVTFTVSEDIYTRPLGSFRPDLRPEANRLIPAYKDRWFPPGLAVIFTLYPLAISTAVANLSAPGGHQTARYLYAAGAVFSALHFAFGPRDLAILRRLGEKDRDEDNGAAMAQWVRMNCLRGLLADFPSWVCYLAGDFIAAAGSGDY